MNNCITAILFLLLLAGCKIDQDKKVDRAKFNFTIGDDSELFFRNVRQLYYDRYSPDGTWQAYRFSDRYLENIRPVILPVIVINWLNDEAYLLIETNDLLNEEDFICVTVTDPQTLKTDTLVLKERGSERMLEFGSQVYEAIMSNQHIAAKIKGSFVPILTEEVDREAFRVPMSDFYRLIRVF